MEDHRRECSGLSFDSEDDLHSLLTPETSTQTAATGMGHQDLGEPNNAAAGPDRTANGVEAAMVRYASMFKYYEGRTKDAENRAKYAEKRAQDAEKRLAELQRSSLHIRYFLSN